MGNVESITDQELSLLLADADKKNLLFVDFWAEWCGPCRMVEPVIEELSTEFTNIKFTKVNVDENPEAAAMFGVRTIPTFVVFKNNKLVYRHSGAAPKSFFVEKLSTLI